MNIFEAAFGFAVAAAIIPYKVVVKPVSEEENTPKTITVESLTYRVEATPENKVANITVPAEGIKKVAAFVKDKCGIVKEKAVVAKDKVAEKVNNARARRAEKRAAAEDPAETITIEIPVEDEAIAEA